MKGLFDQRHRVQLRLGLRLSVESAQHDSIAIGGLDKQISGIVAGDDHVTYWVPAGCLMLRRCPGAIRQSALAHRELKQIQPAA